MIRYVLAVNTTKGLILCWLLSCCVLAALQGCGGEEELPSVNQQSYAGHVVCGGSNTIQGIDVSKYQGTVNWQSVKGAGIGFAFARVSDGLKSPDAFFAGNGLPVVAGNHIVGQNHWVR